MFDRLRGHVLRLLRVPHDPDPPAGAAGSLLVFRAGHNYYKLRLLRWGLGQVGALAGIIVSLWGLNWIETQAELARGTTQAETARKSAPASTPLPPPPDASSNTAAAAEAATPAPAKTKKTRPDGKQRARHALKQIADRSPPWLFPTLRFFEFFGILVYLLQIPVTYAMARLDYELRWYMVTDRSLRIRTGLASVLESTMSFANVQQVVVSQGPLQRLLGLSDVRVQSAGGGGGGEHGEQQGAAESLHTGVFHGVDNASQIRDLILDRLRLFRETGLGDPDDRHTTPAPTTLGPAAPLASLSAARELLAETRALKAALR